MQIPSHNYDDPSKVPLVNGPLRVVTPPSLKPSLSQPDKRIFELLFPQPMLISDRGEWPNLHIKRGADCIELAKPILTDGTFEAPGRLGNETPEAYCTIIHAVVDKGASSDSAEVISSVIESTLAWMRVRARHYWLLHGSTGFGASYRGSIVEDGRMANFVSFGPTVVVRPVSRGIWELIAGDVSDATSPPISESIFCDGLLSAVSGDELKALLELGVACEVELTQLLTAAAGSGPASADKSLFLSPRKDSTKGDYASFSDKLGAWPQLLGLDAVADYPTTGIPPRWVDLIEELYGMRGGVAHGGRKKQGGTTVQSYIMAANALFAYSQSQKAKLNLPRYPYASNENPTNQVMLYRDKAIFANATQGP